MNSRNGLPVEGKERRRLHGHGWEMSDSKVRQVTYDINRCTTVAYLGLRGLRSPQKTCSCSVAETTKCLFALTIEMIDGMPSVDRDLTGTVDLHRSIRQRKQVESCCLM